MSSLNYHQNPEEEEESLAMQQYSPQGSRNNSYNAKFANNNPNNRKNDSGGGGKGGGGLNFQNTRIVNMLFSTVLFGLGLLFLIVGIIFVTVYYYPYSFTNFSTILCAGLFIAFGSVVMIIAVINIILVRLERNQLVILTTFVALVLFIILLIIGIWGLIATTSNSMSYEVRQNMQDTISNYDQSNMYHFSTQKINWVQQTFNCCGIVNYMDWKSVFVNSYGPNGYQQQFQPNYYLNQMQPQPNNVPYISQVPDSCCVRMYANCGRNFNTFPQDSPKIYGPNQYLSGTGNGQGVFQGGYGNYPISGNGVGSWGYNGAMLPNQNIYTQGCLPMYIERYYRELMFIAIYCTIVAGVSVLACVVYIVLYFMTLKKKF